MTSTTTRRVRAAAASALTAALLATAAGTVAPAQAAVPAAERGPGQVSSWTIQPGRIGPLTIGMGYRQLRATGVFVSAGENDPCGAEIEPKPRFSANTGYGLDQDRNTLTFVQTVQRGTSTPRGIKVGATLRQVRKAYPGASKPRRGTQPGTHFVVVHRGKRAMGISVDQPGKKLGPDSTVYGFSVSRGRAYSVYFDGC